ncbi:hypothetical protein RQP46_008733 [Phenoliferia psychrophenolica]
MQTLVRDSAMPRSPYTFVAVYYKHGEYTVDSFKDLDSGLKHFVDLYFEDTHSAELRRLMLASGQEALIQKLFEHGRKLRERQAGYGLVAILRGNEEARYDTEHAIYLDMKWENGEYTVSVGSSGYVYEAMDELEQENGDDEWEEMDEEDQWDMRSFLSLVASFLALATASSAYSETVYLIRHGEKPADGSNGLSATGDQRAQCLRNVFSASSAYNIGYIMAETPKSDGSRARPVETVTPLAQDLGLVVDTKCDRDDAKCVATAVQKYEGSGPAKNTLICWEHDALTDILTALGVKNAPSYPDNSFNIIWTVQNQKLVSSTSEHCPGLDSN